MTTSFVSSHGNYGSTCGYCDSSESMKFGLTAYTLACQEYRDLVDRGWRRSGTYLYKPNIRECCCPQYTIRLDVSKFQASKSQRKLISRFNRYIEGTYDPFNKDTDTDITNNDKTKQQPLNKKNTKTFNLIESIHESEKIKGKHEFKVVLEKSSFTQEKYNLFFKYQTKIHMEEEYEVSERGFRRFLVDSPLKYEPSSKPNTPGYGSFHQCYYLDDKLIAVAVLDFLPSCVSSVYFLYDNDYSFMQLGKYSALKEIAMTLEFYNEGLKDLHWYYMGYYIHSCQKMNYKGQYKPSELLDPETYEWYSIDKFVPQLEKTKYVTFANVSTVESSALDKQSLPPPGMLDPKKVTDNDINDLKLFINGEIISFGASPPFIKDNINIKNKLKNFYAAVGPVLAKRMVNCISKYCIDHQEL